MAYQDTTPVKKPAGNPILGDSEYEPRRKAFQSEYKDYIRKSLETSRSLSTSKREAKHLEKLREASEKSPQQQEVNLYATKQRYKYSYFNSVSGAQGRDESQDRQFPNQF